MTNEQLAWLAGLLEGEGCFRAYKPKTKKYATEIRIYLCSSDLDVIERAAQLMGNPTIRTRTRKHSLGSKPLHEIGISGEPAAIIMRLIEPWMGSRRKAKISEALQMWANRITHAQAMRMTLAAKRKCKETKSLFVMDKAACQ